MKYLWPLETLFRFLVAVRNALYSMRLMPIKKLPGMVISVGNISIGGTGKSPLVMDFTRSLQRAGARVVILTRGYKSGLSDDEWQVLYRGQIVAGTSRSGVCADEAMMQSLALQDSYIVVGAKRFDAANHFLRYLPSWKPTHWILDDGFQHRQIHRDVDAVVVDVRRPWGACLPAGRFREPKSSLRRASMVILTKSTNDLRSDEVSKEIRLLNKDCIVYEARFDQGDLRQVYDGGSMPQAEDTYALVCSVANPKDVAEALRKQGVNIVSVFSFPDHSNISYEAVKAGQGGFSRVVTTEKDWARDQETLCKLGLPVFVAPLVISWRGFSPEFV